MSSVRVLVGTRKGGFILTSDGKRDRWDVSGPHFGGWEIYHMKGSPVDPNRLYASQSSGWFGQVIQRSNDGGQTWEPVGNQFAYDGVPGTHQWYDGTPHPWEFKRVWHLEPSLTDPDIVYAGVEDAALFRTTDGGADLARAAGPARARLGLQVGARRRRPVPAHDPARSDERQPDVHRDLVGRRVSHGRWRAELEADQPGAAFAVHPRPDRRGRPLRPSHRHAPIAARTSCSCRSTGT